MPKYVVEREVPGVGASTSEQLHGISKKSCGVLQALGPEITWVTSYVTGDKIYCASYRGRAAALRGVVLG